MDRPDDATTTAPQNLVRQRIALTNPQALLRGERLANVVNPEVFR